MDGESEADAHTCGKCKKQFGDIESFFKHKSLHQADGDL